MSRSSLRDAAAIASTLCQIAKGVVVLPNGATKAASRGPARPWPTQTALKASSTDTKDADSNHEAHTFASSGLEPDAASTKNAVASSSRPWPSKSINAAATSSAPAKHMVDKVASVYVAADATPSSPSSTVPFEPPPPPPAPQSPGAPIAKESQVDTASQPPIDLQSPATITSDTPAAEDIESAAIPRTDEPPSATVSPPHQPESSSPIAPASTPGSIDVPPIPEEPSSLPEIEEYDAVAESKHVPLRAAKVPSSRLGRLFHYGGLGAGLAFGAAGSFLRGSSSSSEQSLFMSEQNVARLVDKLSTMRGAALKLGQFLSIQETKLLPPQIEQVLLRVQNSANYMPVWQMNQVMSAELGADWRGQFAQFEDVPFASASIGQVHSAVLRDDFPDSTMAGQKVAVKVQFPGVLESIDSDLSYLRWLVSASALLPKGLFLENTLRVLGRELRDECDYTREAEMGRRFGEILHDSAEFEVPKVVDSLCTGKVLTTEMMRGRPLSQASRYPQATRDRIAQSILNLSLSELFRFRLMQTDPNWSNFLYNERTAKIQLIDFGATREYSKTFMDSWLQMLQAAIAGDYDECLVWSRKVGYLTGDESEGMERAHVESMIALGEPFRPDAPDPYPFEHQTITDRVKAQIPLMLRERLTPPPQETYSLNRKLSGAFLLCARLKAHVSCRSLFEAIEKEYRIGPDGAAAASAGASSPFSSPEQRRHFHSAFRAQRQHGRNLLDRFPRSKLVLSAEPGPSTGSAEIGDEVESLSPGPPVSESIQPTPADAVESGTPVDVTRAASAAEVSLPSTPEPTPPAPASMGPTLIRGIVIPLKPPPPGPEECCMSGCAHCAYDIYAEDLEHFHSRLSSVRTQLTQLHPPVSRDEWRADLLGDYPTGQAGEMTDGERKERAQREVDRVISDLDPTMKAFLEMERKLKRQERDKAQDQTA